MKTCDSESAFPTRRFAIAISLYVVLLTAFGHLFHPVQVIGIESDDYVGMAERLLGGQLPSDPFRPMLYPILTAGLGWVLGDCFAAAKVVSSVFAGLFVGCGYLLARHCFGARVGLLTALLLVCNGWVFTVGVSASTDMIFAGSSVLTLWLSARIGSGAGRGRVLTLSAAFAMAYFSRYQASMLVLAVLPALWLAPESGSGVAADLRLRLRRVLGFGLGACLFLLPHFVLTTLAFGHPLHSENWRNIALKHFGQLEFRELRELPFDGTLSVLMHDPARLFAQGWGEFCRYAGQGYPVLLQGGGDVGWFGVGLALLSMLGLLLVMRRRYLPQLGVFAYGPAYLLVICLLFMPRPRMVFAVLPAMYALIGLVLHRACGRFRLAEGFASLVGAGLLFGVAWNSVDTLERYQRSHPMAEIAVAEALLEHVSYPPRILSTYGSLRRYVSVDCAMVHPPYLRFEVDDYLQQVIQRAEETGRAYIVIGAVSVGRDRFEQILARDSDRISVEFRSEDAAVLRVSGLELDWIDSAVVSPTPYLGGPLTMSVELRPEVDPAAVKTVLMIATSLEGERISMPLNRGPGRSFSLTLNAVQIVTGSWSLTPLVVDLRDRAGPGQSLSLDVPVMSEK